MKKFTLLALSAAIVSTTAIASDVNFTDLGIGVGVGTTKYEGAKRIANIDAIVDYGLQLDENVVGIVEGKLKAHDSKLQDNAYGRFEQRGRLGVGYLLGYKVAPSILPYAKLSGEVVKFKKYAHDGSYSASDTNLGYGFGAGVKAAVVPNFELGVEYLRTGHRFESTNIKGNTFSTSATYRF